MDIIFEKKLSSKDRKKMKDTKFGLPSQRKYPLNDEEHVRKAIQFFKYCPQKDRLELANNINKKIKEFNMTVNVSKDNPFYKFANKTMIKESFEFIEDNKNNVGCKYCKKIISEYVRNIRKILFIDSIDNKKEIIIKIEEITKEAILNIQRCNQCDTKHTIDIINYIADENIRGIGGYIDYENDSLNESSYELDILVSFADSIKENFNDIGKGLTVLEYMNNDDLLKSIVSRKYGNPNHNDSIIARNYVLCNNNLYTYINTAYKTGLESFMNYTKQMADNQIKNELYIIDTPNKNGGVPMINLSRLESWSSKNNVKLSNFNSADIFKFNNINSIEEVREVYDINGESIYIGNDKKDDDIIYLLGVNKESNASVELIKVDDVLEEYFSGISDNAEFDVKHIKFIPKDISNESLAETITSITEGFSVDEDGNIKITISPKQSYMDEYSQNHKLLIENWKNKNYEGVKTNIAFAFTLIGVIERDKRYKEKDPEVIKARAFAINDFKTYLKKLQSVEKDFDFTDYYIKNKFDKKIIDIPKSTIVGIKQLLKTIFV